MEWCLQFMVQCNCWSKTRWGPFAWLLRTLCRQIVPNFGIQWHWLLLSGSICSRPHVGRRHGFNCPFIEKSAEVTDTLWTVLHRMGYQAQCQKEQESIFWQRPNPVLSLDTKFHAYWLGREMEVSGSLFTSLVHICLLNYEIFFAKVLKHNLIMLYGQKTNWLEQISGQ